MKFYKPLALALIPLMILGGCLFQRASLSEKVRPHVVILTSDRGTCSGFHIETEKATYIMTAAHCKELQDESGYINAKDDEMSAPLPVKVLAESAYADLLLLEALPDHRGLKLADSIEMHNMIASFTHGAGLDTYRTDGELIQRKQSEMGLFEINTAEDAERCESAPKYKIVTFPTFFGIFTVCAISAEFWVSTAQTVPGSSGGVLVDMNGDVVGVVSGGNEVFTLLVPLDQIEIFLAAW